MSTFLFFLPQICGGIFWILGAISFRRAVIERRKAEQIQDKTQAIYDDALDLWEKAMAQRGGAP
jgi:hypothetical protein